MVMSVLIALVIGFISGILVNLIADYLPGRRHHRLASSNPFVSKSVVPPKPSFFPRRADGSIYPGYLWSGVIAMLTGVTVYKDHRARHILVEIGLAVAFAVIAWV